MTKKKIERVSVMHRKEITWLRWYFKRSKKNPEKTILEQKIHECFLRGDIDNAAFYVNIKTVTAEVIEETDDRLLKTIKEVYVYERINVVGACQRILYMSSTSAYTKLNEWFDSYFLQTYKYVSLHK